MSSALVRQALEFVDQEESGGKRARRRRATAPTPGHEHLHPYRQKQNNKKCEVPQRTSEQTAEENIRKLLALSKPTADKVVAEKIVERAVKGKPLLEKIEVKKEECKSILFPDEEPFKTFEEEYFCS